MKYPAIMADFSLSIALLQNSELCIARAFRQEAIEDEIIHHDNPDALRNGGTNHMPGILALVLGDSLKDRPSFRIEDKRAASVRLPNPVKC